MVYYAKGNLKREDVHYDGLKQTLTNLTDGEVAASWSRSDEDAAGQATIQRVEALNLAINVVELLNPFYLYTHPVSAREVGLEVIEETDATVTVRLYHGSFDFRYEKFGEYLRPLTVGSLYVPKDGPPEENISLRYQYGKGPDGKDLVCPVTIEHISELHNIHVTHTLKRVNFSPQLDDSLFAFKFAEGTWVNDTIAGISERNYVAGQPLSSLANEIDSGISDGSDSVKPAVTRKSALDTEIQDLEEAAGASSRRKTVAIIACLLLIPICAAGFIAYFRKFLRRRELD